MCGSLYQHSGTRRFSSSLTRLRLVRRSFSSTVMIRSRFITSLRPNIRKNSPGPTLKRGRWSGASRLVSCWTQLASNFASADDHPRHSFKKGAIRWLVLLCPLDNVLFCGCADCFGRGGGADGARLRISRRRARGARNASPSPCRYDRMAKSSVAGRVAIHAKYLDLNMVL